ncbi:MAG TPA: sulfite exporter TauE/SafE family protein [Anaerolineaceae bacterium]|nr:sulfite exporter TauE/SafE family protein [Anaerolineaceae bacterium]
MTSLLVAFITGLTTGGLSCMAVQGGLLASSLANQIEQDVRKSAKKKGKGSFKLALPILLFLAAKLLAYTVLGALLGALGQVLQLTPTMQAILQFAIAIFMIGNALRMLNVHPIFRYFTFEPPASVTRYLRRKSKGGGSWFTPLFLGALTVLIPCGVTQTMMAAAIATGNPLQGAALMFAFVLGTSPVFFVLSYFATRLGALLEKYFVRIVAVVLLVLGFLAFDTGLNLLGSPVSLTRLVNNLRGNEVTQQAGVVTALPSSDIVLQAVDDGYLPTVLHAPAGVPVTLHLVTNGTYSCSRAFLIPALDYGTILKATGEETVQIPAQIAGTVLPFTCSMGMYTGEIIFDL